MYFTEKVCGLTFCRKYNAVVKIWSSSTSIVGQIMELLFLYQLSLSLFKEYNVDSDDLNFETLTLIDQMIFTSRQINFQILRNNRRKIGLNTTANKLYHLNNLIALERLNLKYVHFKKQAKVQFLKYGKT